MELGSTETLDRAQTRHIAAQHPDSGNAADSKGFPLDRAESNEQRRDWQLKLKRRWAQLEDRLYAVQPERLIGLARLTFSAFALLATVLVLALVTRLAEHIPGIAGGPFERLAKDVYEYLKDMALIFVTVVAAYLASVFQKRHNFIEALREEWHDIIKAKSALFAYTQIEKPTQRDYVAAFCAISETIDNMLGLQECG